MQPVLTQNAAAPAGARGETAERTGRRREAGRDRRRNRFCRRPARPRARRYAAARLSRRVRSIRVRPGRRRSRNRRRRPVGARAGGSAAAGARAEPDRARDRHGSLPAGRPARRRRGPRPRPATATPPRPPTQRLAPLDEPRPPQPRTEPAEPGAEQGRRSARHPGLSAPPGELTASSRHRHIPLRPSAGEGGARRASAGRVRWVPAGRAAFERPSQCDTAAAACSSTSAPVVKRSSANGAASGCGSSRAIVWAKTQPAPGVALNPPVPQPPFR